LVGSSSRSEVGSWGDGVLDYQDATSRPSGTADDAAPAGRALTRLKEDACPKSVGALGDLVEVRDLDVGQPRRPVGPALDDPAGEPAAPACGLRWTTGLGEECIIGSQQVQILAVPRIHHPDPMISWLSGRSQL
jgi:hypothetical protein